MKKILKQTLVLASLALLAGTAGAQTIKNTPHNLTSSGEFTNTADATAGNQICVFCHTPHGAENTTAAPLWNKSVPAGSSFTTYADMNSSTIDGEILEVGSVSLACLSCHDGTQAMDNIINSAGRQGYNSTGGGTTGLNYTWTTANSRVDADGKLGANNVANLKQDLRNDHPIGIQYCGGGVTGSGTTATVNCNDTGFETADIVTKEINGQQAFWIDRGTVANYRDKNDIILYTRTFADGAGPSVECASCHDPHVPEKGTDNVAFMRVTTNNSDICLACHVK